jgi:hypothetical protein
MCIRELCNDAFDKSLYRCSKGQANLLVQAIKWDFAAAAGAGTCGSPATMPLDHRLRGWLRHTGAHAPKLHRAPHQERETTIARCDQILDECTTQPDIPGETTLSSVLASRGGVLSLTLHLLLDNSGV